MTKTALAHARTVLITGATGGVGRALAAALGERGWTVFAAGRDESKARRTVEELRRADPAGRFEPVWGDLSRPHETRALAAQLLDRTDRLDALVNNAAVNSFERTETAEGFELQFAANCLAPFLLTRALAPALAGSGGGRVVNVASEIYEQVKALEPEDLPAGADFAPMTTYARTKLGLVWLTQAFARRLAAADVTVNAAHPGFVASGMTRDASGLWRAVFLLTKPFQKSPAKGAATPLHLVESDDVAGVTGAFFSRCARRDLTLLGSDQERGERLFALCQSLTGEP